MIYYGLLMSKSNNSRDRKMLVELKLSSCRNDFLLFSLNQIHYERSHFID